MQDTAKLTIYHGESCFVCIVEGGEHSVPQWSPEYLENYFRTHEKIPLHIPFAALAFNFELKFQPVENILQSPQYFWGFCNPLNDGGYALNLLLNQEVLLLRGKSLQDMEQFHWDSSILYYGPGTKVSWSFVTCSSSSAELDWIQLPDTEIRFLTGWRQWRQAAQRWARRELPQTGWLIVTLSSGENPSPEKTQDLVGTPPPPLPCSCLLVSCLAGLLLGSLHFCICYILFTVIQPS